MAPLPAADQRHPWLRYQVEGYIKGIICSYEQRLETIWSRPVNRVHVLDFEGLTPTMRQNLEVRLRMVYTREGQQVFVCHAWRRLFEIRAPLVYEFILEFLSTCRMSDIEMGLDVADMLCFQLGGIRRRMTWRQFILALGLHIKQEMAEAGMIVYNISSRGQAPGKVTGVDLFYLRNMDRGTTNVPHLLTQYLFRHAEGRKSRDRLSRVHFIGHLAMHFVLVGDEGLKGFAGLGSLGTKEAPPPPPPAPQPQTMSQRIKRIEEEDLAKTMIWYILKRTCIELIRHITYEWDEEDVLSDDNEMVEVKVLMALSDDENVAVGKEKVNLQILMRNKNLRKRKLTTITKTWINRSNKVNQCISEQISTQKKRILRVDQLTKDPSSSGQKDLVFIKSTADDTKVSIPSVERPWLSEVEGFILPNHDTGRILPAESQMKVTDPSVTKLDGAEPVSGPKTVKSILKSNSTFKAETLKDDIPLSVVMKELNDLKLQIYRNQSSYSRNNTQQCDIGKPIWYLDSGCSRHMTGVKIYLHRYVEQQGLKVVFGDDCTCTTEGYGSIKRAASAETNARKSKGNLHGIFLTTSFTSLGSTLLILDQLEKNLDKEEFQEIGSMDDFRFFLAYTQTEVQKFRDTLIQHMEYVKKSIDERAHRKREYDSRVNEIQMQSKEGKVDSSKALDASLVVTECSETKSSRILAAGQGMMQILRMQTSDQ
ncbi:hypothetical protein Tco_1368310 [Tanacetum coccineum]